MDVVPWSGAGVSLVVCGGAAELEISSGLQLQCNSSESNNNSPKSIFFCSFWLAISIGTSTLCVRI